MRYCYLLLLLIGSLSLHAQTKSRAHGEGQSKVFRAGAAMSNITPKIGTSINGNFQDGVVKTIHDELHARSIVLDDGKTRLAFVVADLCMVPVEVINKAKLRAHHKTQIPLENMLMSATHTHSAGTACPVFQSDPDKEYVRFLSQRLGDAIIRANHNLAPARIGWGVGQEPNHVFNRRWKMKTGNKNPFGIIEQLTTNPGMDNPDRIEPAGPTDPDVAVISVVSTDGRPIALLANYSLHYVGGGRSGEISADYFGMFCNRMEKMLGAGGDHPPFVAIMSNGSSGDINNIDVQNKKRSLAPYGQMEFVANALAAEVSKVVKDIEYFNWVPLAVEQEDLLLGVRLPDTKEIQEAERILSKAESGPLMKKEEIFARETILISKYPEKVPVILQAMRLGDLAITAVPCEVFVEIGLEIKKKSSFKPTFNISLANGYNGYLPTPQHHRLGGYETWRARSSYLEPEASEKIVQTLSGLLNQLQASKPAGDFEEDRPDATVQLFNGKNLNGWYTFLKGRGRDSDPRQVFQVRDGLLHISGEEWGCVTTEKEFANYKLVVDFKWGNKTYEPRIDKARDSGILLHSKGADGGYNGIWMHSIECQIIEGGTGDILVVGDGSTDFSATSTVAPEKQGSAHLYEPEGDPVTIHRGRINWYGRDPAWSDMIDFRGQRDVEKPVGEWNQLECVARGDEILVYLNGVLVNHATGVKPEKGRIQIQSEGAEIIIRKVELTPLKDK